MRSILWLHRIVTKIGYYVFWIIWMSFMSPPNWPYMFDYQIFRCWIYHRPQHSCGKVMFSQASVILFTGGVSARQPPPWADTLPLGRPLPRSRRLLQRTVRILLECILIQQRFTVICILTHTLEQKCKNIICWTFLSYWNAFSFNKDLLSFVFWPIHWNKNVKI